MSKALSISSCPTDCLYISSADTSVQLLCPFSTKLFAFLFLSSKVRGNHTLVSLKQKVGYLSFHCQTRVPAVCRLPLSPIFREDRAQLPLGGSVQFSSVAQLCPTLCDPWTVAHQAFLSITNSWSLLKFMSIKSVMLSNHLILSHPLLLLPANFPSIRVFSSESVLCIRWPKLQHQSFPWEDASRKTQGLPPNPGLLKVFPSQELPFL